MSPLPDIIALTGKLADWDEHPDIPLVEADDGDITLQYCSDFLGRWKQHHGHTNFGFSGYFKLYIYFGGSRRRLKDWWCLFPEKEHYFSAGNKSAAAQKRIEEIIATRKGSFATKVKGGYSMGLERIASGVSETDR